MKLSRFGQRFLGESGIVRLMDDLGHLAQREGVIMLGGGNPGYIPEMHQVFCTRIQCMLDNEDRFKTLLGAYPPPIGDQAFVDALAELLREVYDWEVGPKNILLTNGSQNAFFFLFNMFGGTYPDGSHKKILLPLTPEYIGYEDVGIEEDLFVARRPQIEYLEGRLFKYHVNFDALEISDDVGAICVSRPTNPTGNVLTDDEIEKLSVIARAHNIPFIVDNAYGAPFPGVLFTEARPRWDPHRIMCMSLSKLGLPGARTGIVIAEEQVIHALTGMNAIINLSPGNLGAALVTELVRSREIIRLSNEVVRPFYQYKRDHALACLREELKGHDFYIHKPEGAFFLWLWLKGLPITSREFYERLKARGVVVVPGRYFFPGLREAWRHREQCIRLSYAGDEDRVAAGIRIIAEEVRRAYALGKVEEEDD